MARKIRTISLTLEEDQFLDEYKISPTDLIRQKLSEMRGGFMGMKIRVKELEDESKQKSEIVKRLLSFIREKALLDDYSDFLIKYEGKNV